MENHFHRFHELFQQLGLGDSAADIDAFIHNHAPLAENTRLSDAPFWSAAQASFLREAMQDDSDWCELADQLSAVLRQPPPNDIRRKP